MQKRLSLLDALKAEIRRAEKRGITRYRLAQLSGVTNATISRIMSGKLKSPGVALVQKLADALEMEITLRRPES